MIGFGKDGVLKRGEIVAVPNGLLMQARRNSEPPHDWWTPS